jgi:hypothetical protein
VNPKVCLILRGMLGAPRRRLFPLGVGFASELAVSVGQKQMRFLRLGLNLCCLFEITQGVGFTQRSGSEYNALVIGVVEVVMSWTWLVRRSLCFGLCFLLFAVPAQTQLPAPLGRCGLRTIEPS